MIYPYFCFVDLINNHLSIVNIRIFIKAGPCKSSLGCKARGRRIFAYVVLRGPAVFYREQFTQTFSRTRLNYHIRKESKFVQMANCNYNWVKITNIWAFLFYRFAHFYNPSYLSNQFNLLFLKNMAPYFNKISGIVGIPNILLK